MNFLDILGGLARRWYITVPGILLAVTLGIGAWVAMPPSLQRSASLLVLPGVGSLPAESANPYLYLGGVTTATEVLVRAAGSDSSLEPILRAHPDVSIEIGRDGTTAGPVVLITVTAPTDEEAATVLDDIEAQTTALLETMQADEGIGPGNRLTASTISKDVSSTPQQRTRVLLAGGLALGAATLAIVLAVLIDGLVRNGSRDRSRRAARSDARAPGVTSDRLREESEIRLGDVDAESLASSGGPVSDVPRRVDAESAPFLRATEGESDSFADPVGPTLENEPSRVEATRGEPSEDAAPGEPAGEATAVPTVRVEASSTVVGPTTRPGQPRKPRRAPRPKTPPSHAAR